MGTPHKIRLMRREIIQDFLNVPGIVGVALLGGPSTPYFQGFDPEIWPGFNPAQQLMVAQSIQQVLETTPEGFNSFEFQFDSYRAYLHKLNRGTTLLVLTINQLARLTYTQSVRRLLIELQIDQSDPISEFRSLALDMAPPQSPGLSDPVLTNGSSKSAQLSPSTPVDAAPGHGNNQIEQPSGDSAGQPASQSLPPEPTAAPDPASPQAQPADFAADFVAWVEELPHSTSPDPLHPAPLHLAQPNPPPLERARELDLASGVKPVWAADYDPATLLPELADLGLRSASLKDVLAAINRLSQLTSQYLGTLVVSNYWKAARPAEVWLNHFQIERSAQMTFAVQTPSQPLPILTSSQHQHLKDWVAAFLERCSKVIRDFNKIVRQTLTPQETALLFN